MKKRVHCADDASAAVIGDVVAHVGDEVDEEVQEEDGMK